MTSATDWSPPASDPVLVARLFQGTEILLAEDNEANREVAPE